MNARYGAFAFLIAALLWTGCGNESEDGYADDMAEQHAHDTPEASGMVMEPTAPVDTQRVQYGTVAGQTLTGYMAVPAGQDSATANLPGIIVIHEWWGLNENIEAMTRRLAGEGFRALAVNMYGGQVAQTSEEAQALMQEATRNPSNLTDNIKAAYAFLAAEHNAPKVGIMGWCLGGAQSLQGALALPDELDAMVMYYGRVVTDRNQLQTLNMPIIGFFGGQDSGIPVAGVREFESTLKDLGKDVEIHVYDSAGHAFANPSGQNYVEDAAQDSWTKTVAFLKEHLQGDE